MFSVELKMEVPKWFTPALTIQAMGYDVEDNPVPSTPIQISRLDPSHCTARPGQSMA